MSEFAHALTLFERAVARTLQTCGALELGLWTRQMPGRPRIADIVEHMALSNGAFARRLAALADVQPADGTAARLDDDEIPHLFERAAEPPGLAEPSGAWTDRDEALACYAETARAVSDLSLTSAGDMRCKSAPHPIFGPLDGVQWALFAAAHNERHRSEIIGLAAL